MRRVLRLRGLHESAYCETALLVAKQVSPHFSDRKGEEEGSERDSLRASGQSARQAVVQAWHQRSGTGRRVQSLIHSSRKGRFGETASGNLRGGYGCEVTPLSSPRHKTTFDKRAQELLRNDSQVRKLSRNARGMNQVSP